MQPKLHILVLLALWLFLANGCTTARYAKARKSFNYGTELRNQEEAGVNFTGSGTDLSTLYEFDENEVPAGNAEAQFTKARQELTKALLQKRKLRASGLLANAFVLLALTEFQLGNTEEAKAQAMNARTIFDENGANATNDGGRDLALSYAIDPMVTINELYDSILILTRLPIVMDGDSNATTLAIADFYARRISSEANNSLEGALRATDFAISKVNNTRETIQYLRNYEMAALLNNRRLLDKFLVAGQQSGTFRRVGDVLMDQFLFVENRLDELVEDYRLKLLEVSPLGENDPYYRFWKGEVF
ncbi:hypothetical protein CEQ90_14650 [Lewinellaceae bacterium SD302]|nr:hypothetical protein CEQ90_14650 [Lewinellaceae bacterium SD302]